MEKFNDRTEAGQALAELCSSYAHQKDTVVLALPRGGVPIGYEIAQKLSLPLDVFVVRKVGMPNHEELAVGAIASGEVAVYNQDILNQFTIPQSEIDKVIAKEKEELKRREKAYRGDKPPAELKNKTILLADDGVATGATIKAAIKAIYNQKPKEVIIVVPVAAHSTYEELKEMVDDIVCPLRPTYFYAVGAWYDVFDQTSDQEVYDLLAKNNE